MPEVISTASSFMAGAAAACMAVTVTNPIEVVKTRLQLQGELSTRDAKAPKIYRHVGQSMRLILQKDGMRGIQAGLTPAYVYQVFLNGSRLGLYEPMRRLANEACGIDPKERNYVVGVAVGAATGALGATMGSPFYLIKVRMQSYSPTIAVGEQTHYRSIMDGFRTIVSREGFLGLYRGVSAACVRTAIGSSVQLPIYHASTQIIKDSGILSADNTGARTLLASICSGVGVAVVMSPPDVIMTRMYNQRGNLYKGLIDCFAKTIRAEGPLALYKGFSANAMRIGPHTVLSLTFMEWTMGVARWLEGVPLSN